MSSYTEWAVSLVRKFFGPEYQDQRVRLILTREVLDLDESFRALGGMKGFLEAMQDGPEWFSTKSPNLAESGLRLYREWRRKNAGTRAAKYPMQLFELRDAPAFLPLLCLLCLAWTEDTQEVEAHAYYPRLAELYPNSGFERGEATLADWEVLWEGLEEWTADGMWGIFKIERLGGFRHIGLPKSQVIFTPTILSHFPKLFARLGLPSGEQIDPERMRQAILATGHFGTAAVGSNVYNELKNRTDLGDSALFILNEHLENWDGVYEEDGFERGGAGVTPAETRKNLCLALKIDAEGSMWSSTIASIREKALDGIFSKELDGVMTPVSETLSCLVPDGSYVPAEKHPSFWTNGVILDDISLPDGSKDESVTLHLRGRRIRYFDHWDGEWLVESRGLPTSGYGYILIHQSLWQEWNGWVAKTTTEVQDYTLTGLPDDQKLFCISDLSLVSDSDREQMPGGKVSSVRVRPLRLVGGTKCSASTARRVYADYDPPSIVVRSPDDCDLQVRGARAELTDEVPACTHLPGTQVRSYALVVDETEHVVTASLTSQGETISDVAFGVRREHSVEDDYTPTLFISRLGKPSDSDGVSGMLVPTPSEQTCEFEDGAYDAGTSPTEGIWDEKAFKLLEALVLRGKRMPYANFKRLAFKITGEEQWRLGIGIRQLSQLGFVEMQSDSHGRWSHVHPSKPALYALPWQANGKVQAVLTGVTTTKTIKELSQLAMEVMECDFSVSDSDSALVPPRMLFRHEDASAFEELSEAAGIAWSPKPPAIGLAEWSCDLDTWMEDVNWFQDEGPRPAAEYSPDQFRFIDRYSAPWHLRQFIDQYTNLRWHALYCPELCRYDYERKEWIEERTRHAYVSDPTWAAWRVHKAIADTKDLTPIAYDLSSHSLVVPALLSFPCLLARSLVASSGLCPIQVPSFKAYFDPELGVLSEKARPYFGKCLAYRYVPTRVADLVASKVGARIVGVRT